LSNQFIEKLTPIVENANCYVCVGDVLLWLAPLLTSYVTFCGRFETARTDLELAEKRKLFIDWRSMCYDPMGYPTMGSLLIQPIQRIPRYVMLLHEMVKSSWEEHPDFENLKKAQELMQQVALDVNAKMGDDDADDEMMVAQGHFGAFVEILSPGREFVRQTELCVQRRYHKAGAVEDLMHVFLFNDLLVVADKVEDSYEYDGHVPLVWGQATVQLMPDMKHLKYMVRVCSTERCYVFSCASRKEQTAVATELRETICKNQTEEHDSPPPSLSKNQGMNVAEAPCVVVKGTMVREDHNGKKYTTYVLELAQDHTEGSGGPRASTASSSASAVWGTGASSVLNRLFKRYGEFVELEAALREEFTGAIYGSGGLLKSCNVAMLPPAKLFSSNPREVEMRMVMVGMFVQHVMLIPAIAESNQLMNFLEEHVMGWDEEDNEGAAGEGGDGDSDDDEEEEEDAFNTSLAKIGGFDAFSDAGPATRSSARPSTASAGRPSTKAKRTSVMSVSVVGGRGSNRGSGASTGSKGRRPTTRLTVKAGRNSIMLPAQEMVEVRFWHGEAMQMEINTHMRTPEVMQLVGEQLGIVSNGSGQLQLGTCGLYLCGSTKDGTASSSDYTATMGYQLGDTEPSHCLDKAEFPLRALQEKRIRDQRAHLLFQKRLFLRADKYWMAIPQSMPPAGLAPPDSPALQQSSVSGTVSAALGRLLHGQCYAQVVLGCWACDLADATNLAALHAQSELGDYSEAKQEKFEDQHDFIPAPYLGNGTNGSGPGGSQAKPSTAPSLAGSVDLPLYSLVRDPKYKDKSNVFKLKSSDGSLEWRHDYLLHSDSQLDFTEWMEAISQDVAVEGENGEAIVKLNEIAAKASASGGVIDEDEVEDGAAGMKTTTNKEAAEKRMKIAMDLVTGNSMPRKQGWLNKKGHKRRNWNKRWFVLIDKQLLYFKAKPDMALDRAFWKRELRMKWSSLSNGSEGMDGSRDGSRGSADIGGALLGGVDGGATARRMYVERVMGGVPGYGMTVFSARFDTPSTDEQAAVYGMVAASYGGGGSGDGFGTFGGPSKSVAKEPARKSSFPMSMGLGKGKRKTELQSFASSLSGGVGGIPTNVLLAVSEDGLSVLGDSVLEASRIRVRNGAAVLDKEALIALSAEPVICFRYAQMLGLSDFHGELQITVNRNSEADAEEEELHFGFKTEEAHEICLLMQEYMEASKHSAKAVRSSQTEENLGMYKAKRFSARKKSSARAGAGRASKQQLSQ
jgi:hypothetical protein